MLVFVVLVMLALSLLVHGVLVESLAELSASGAAARQLRAETSARSGAQRVLAAGGGVWMDSVTRFEIRIADTLSEGRLSTVATARKLGAEAWLVEGVSRLDGVEVAHAGRLAWSLDPLRRVSALEGAVSVDATAPVLVEGIVDSATPTTLAPPPELGGCGPWIDSLLVRYIASPLAPVATLPPGQGPALGFLDFEAVLSAAEVRVADVGTPGPVEAGGSCVTADPWNWGDPEYPSRPCGAFVALRAAAGDLRVEAGSGQGVLVVDGALTLAGGTRFRGLIITSGALTLEGGAVLEGLALASGGLRVSSGSVVTASACWAVRSLSAQRSLLSGMIPFPDTGWLGPL